MSKATILSVDDDLSVTRALTQVLEAQNYTVQSLNDPLKAKELPEKAEAPDLILLDIHMPELDGYQLCGHFQKHPEWALTPVLFLSAHASEENQTKAFKMGAVGFLGKPLKRQTLCNAVEKYIKLGRQWRKKHMAPPRSTALQSRGSDLQLGSFLRHMAQLYALQLPQGIPAEQLYAFFSEQGIQENQLAQHIAEFSHLQYIPQLEHVEHYLGILSLPFCRMYQVIPIQKHSGKLAFIMSNPFQLELQDMLRQQQEAEWLIAPPQALVPALHNAEKPISKEQEAPVPEFTHESVQESVAATHNLMEEFQNEFSEKHDFQTDLSQELTEDIDSEAPSIIRLVNQLIENAHLMDASDIHLEPWEDAVAVRYRIDGKLQWVGKLTPMSVINPLAARIKIMSNLDITERRLPQDGRIQFQKFTRKQLDIDLRVSTAPMHFGEKIVMRILDKKKSTLPLEKLGFSPQQLVLYREQIKMPYGMILHVGPTGSGKSMTLYAALNEINHPDINIQTVEDPIEYTLYGINQMQVNPEIGLSFAKVLRAYLRQDPDVILVGEIRDRETAATAIEASLTGHLLLSTLHTNDAPSTLIRFVEMGIEPYLLSSSILMICAQRLIRCLCLNCRVAYAATAQEKAWFKYSVHEDLTLYRAHGCEACHQTGFKGRTGVYELLIPNDSLRQALNQKGMSSEALKAIAIKQGMTTLFGEGMRKAALGITSTEEILRLIPQEPNASEFNQDSMPDT